MTSTSSASRAGTGMTCRLAAAAFLALSLALVGPTPAAGQDNQALADELQRLQRELGDLQAYVYNGSPPPTGSSASGGSTVLAGQEVRLQQLETRMSELTGKFEDVTYQLSQISQRLDKLSQDVDFRLSQLEQGGAGAATVGSADATGGQAPATMGAAPPATPGTPTAPPPGTQILGTLTQSQMDAMNQGAAAPAAPAGTQTSYAAPGSYDLPGATPQAQYEYAFGLLKQANYAEAELALAEFVRRNPTDVLAGNAQYWLGETYYVRGDYTNAAVAFADGYQKYPNSGKAGPNLLKLGMALGELGKAEDACVAFSELLKKFPGADTDIVDQAHREQQRFGCG